MYFVHLEQNAGRNAFRVAQAPVSQNFGRIIQAGQWHFTSMSAYHFLGSSEGGRATLPCPPAIPGMSFPFSGPFWTANIPSNHGQIKEIRPESGYLRDIPFGLQTWQWTLRELQVFVAGKIIEPNWWMGIFQKAMIIDYRRVDGSESPWLNQLNPIKSHENPCNISYQLTNDRSSAAYWPGGLRPYSSHAAGL